MYDWGRTCLNVNDARKDLFAKKGRMVDAIRPTADAVAILLKQSICQGSFVCVSVCLGGGGGGEEANSGS